MDFIEILSTYGSDVALIACMVLCNLFGHKDKSAKAQKLFEKRIAKARKNVEKDTERARQEEKIAQVHLETLEQLEKEKEG